LIAFYDLHVNFGLIRNNESTQFWKVF